MLLVQWSSYFPPWITELAFSLGCCVYWTEYMGRESSGLRIISELPSVTVLLRQHVLLPQGSAGQARRQGGPWKHDIELPSVN